MTDNESVRVICRCRPFNQKELTEAYEGIISIEEQRGSVSIRDPSATKENEKNFTFDSAFDWNSEQQDVYNKTARPIVESVLSGYNGTIFAYGQTGTGKTYSMVGNRANPNEYGILPNAFAHLFAHIAECQAGRAFLVRASYLEIYNEEVRDLLTGLKERLDIKEHPETGVYVKGLSTVVVQSVDEMLKLMDIGNSNRAVGATAMNIGSSRSHSIFSITVEVSEKGEDGQDHIRAGKLHLVDLAGSERQSKTGATGERLKEATKINLSLSALGNVISALVDGKSTHIPYRDSKLTRLLQDSLGGNAKTMMIATISPASYNYEETLSTLRYANRAKNIKNKPKINEDPKDAMLREFQEEIRRLKEQLEKLDNQTISHDIHIQEIVEVEDLDEEESEEEQEGDENEEEIEIGQSLENNVNQEDEQLELQLEEEEDEEEDEEEYEINERDISVVLPEERESEEFLIADFGPEEEEEEESELEKSKKITKSQEMLLYEEELKGVGVEVQDDEAEKELFRIEKEKAAAIDKLKKITSKEDKKALKNRKVSKRSKEATVSDQLSNSFKPPMIPNGQHQSGEQKGSKKSKKKKQSKDATSNVPTSKVDLTQQTEDIMIRMKQEIEAEKKAIVESKDMIEEEKTRILGQLETRAQELENERQRRSALSEKIAQMQAKLLVGGVHVLDKNEQQKQELAKRQSELEERRRQEQELHRELEHQQETQLQIEEEYSSLQEEVQVKTKKLKKLWALYQSHKEEVNDLQHEIQREREDLLETIRGLSTELRLRVLIINSFIPPEEQSMIEAYSLYDEAADKWRMAHMARGGNHIKGKRSMITGQLLGLHRQDTDFEKKDMARKMVEPMDVYLTYGLVSHENIPALYREGREGKGLASKLIRPSAVKRHGSKGSTRRSRTSSQMAASGSSSGENSAKQVRLKEEQPQARGLVARAKHYA